jgi:hypothetical protein
MPLLILGIVLTAVSWYFAWSHVGPASEYSFFPLWVGYILLVNGLSEVMTGTSLLRRMRWSFLWLFVISIPMWWFFEYMNTIVQNWHYVFAHPISILHYEIQASIDFSTVVPAVLSISILVFQPLERRSLNTRIAIPGTTLLIAFVSTFILFWLLNLFPSETFPLVWIVPILFLEPLAYALGVRASLVRQIEQGNLALPLSLGIGTLITGFWWECWNFYSLPKWIYTIPYVGFWKVFEMPFLGYLGYPFFGLIVFSYAALILNFIAKQDLAKLFSSQS